MASKQNGDEKVNRATVTDFLVNNRRILKFHELMLKEICGEYHLTLVEATIISFLYNNPGKDTAADIAELRMIQKGNVSTAVELLVQKNLISRIPDRTDRRKVHLALTEKAAPLVQSVDRMQNEFEQALLAGMSLEEQKIFLQANRKMWENIERMMDRRNKNEK